MTPERINEKDSLVNLKVELAELMQLREDPELKPEERAAIDQQITVYVQANLRKVDNVRAFWRYCEDVMDSAARDRKDAEARYKSAEAKLEFLKSLCCDTMTAFGEKKLEGAHGFIRLQANGGPVALDIYSAALIPEELVLYRGWMSSQAMALLPPEVTARQDFQFEREPRQGAIRAELEKPCDICKGGGGTAYNADVCNECGGTGKRLVPGARLAERGKHARIR